MTSPYQAKFFAHALTGEGGSGEARLQQSLLNASVDLNPHQVEAALFALHSPVSKGVMLADEVGLGKTIEAGLVLCQLWAERKRKLLVICPASLRKQWQCELEDKFNLPCQIVDLKSMHQLQREGFANPYEKPVVLISSYAFAAGQQDFLKQVPWDMVTIDEAHKLRNSYRESARVGQRLRWALADRRKLLLTATPLQNNLTELYGIATLIDPDYFGDLASFRSRYVNQGGDIEELRRRLKEFTWRTLRKDVLAYVKYTERIPMTETFECSEREMKLYDDISAYLQDTTTYAFPHNQRHMLTLLVRKLLASSTQALIGTLEGILGRLERIRKANTLTVKEELDRLIGDEPDLVDELEEDLEDETDENAADTAEAPALPDLEQDEPVDLEKLSAEIELVKGFITRAYAIGTDTKAHHLLTALKSGWEKLKELGARQKAVIFTESRRSMLFLKDYLEANGYAGEVLTFSGGGRNNVLNEEVYRAYRDAHPEDRSSKSVMVRHAVIESFRRDTKILIATEAGAEGLNLQFCSMIVNYDLPWNPQRVEQRIGRCHRYGQKFDVVVVNFCNVRNAADVRVYQLLSQKFQLFEGLFGASNDVLGLVDDEGKGFETRIHEILQLCRTREEIEAAFDKLQKDLADEIAERMAKTRKDVIENLDEDVRKLLKIDQGQAQTYLSESERRFMLMTREVLGDKAEFTSNVTFTLKTPPAEGIETGSYELRRPDLPAGVLAYRPNTPLGEWSVETAKHLETPLVTVTFDMTHHEGRIAVLENLIGKSGTLRLDLLSLNSLDKRDFTLFSAYDDEGNLVDADVAEQFFKLDQTVSSAEPVDPGTLERLEANTKRYADSVRYRVNEQDNDHFKVGIQRIEDWREDKVGTVSHQIEILKGRKREVERQIALARTIEEQGPLQDELAKVQRDIRKKRAELFETEDEADSKANQLRTELTRRLVLTTSEEQLFTIRWKVI